MVPVGGGFSVGPNIGYIVGQLLKPPPATVEFEPGVVQSSLIEVPAGTIAYLGDFTATLKTAFRRYDIEKSSGELTDGGKRRAYEMVKAVYGDSPWALKLKPPVFGIFVDQLPAHMTQTTGADNGVLVLAVGKDSPASKVGIETGDVVQQIGDKSITDRQSFNQVLDQYAGKTVTVKYVRNGTEHAVEVAFNEGM